MVRSHWCLRPGFGDWDRHTDQYHRLLEPVEALHCILARRVDALSVPEQARHMS